MATNMHRLQISLPPWEMQYLEEHAPLIQGIAVSERSDLYIAAASVKPKMARPTPLRRAQARKVSKR